MANLVEIGQSVTGLLPLLAATGGAISGAKFVQEGQRGLKLRFGKVVRNRNGRPKVVRPGFCFVIPTIEHLRRTHVRQRTFNFPTQAVMLRDGTVFHVSAVLVCRLQDDDSAIYRALFEIDDLPGSVSDYCSAVLYEALSERTHDQIADRESLLDEVTERVTPKLTEWGVHLDRFQITDCSPSSDTARLILISTETGFRAQALIDAGTTLTSHNLPMSPTVAAALIGTPVSVALTSHTFAARNTRGGTDIEEEEDD